MRRMLTTVLAADLAGFPRPVAPDEGGTLEVRAISEQVDAR